MTDLASKLLKLTDSTDDIVTVIICVYIYIYMYALHIYIYIYICICVCLLPLRPLSPGLPEAGAAPARAQLSFGLFDRLYPYYLYLPLIISLLISSYFPLFTERVYSCPASRGSAKKSKLRLHVSPARTSSRSWPADTARPAPSRLPASLCPRLPASPPCPPKHDP